MVFWTKSLCSNLTGRDTLLALRRHSMYSVLVKQYTNCYGRIIEHIKTGFTIGCVMLNCILIRFYHQLNALTLIFIQTCLFMLSTNPPIMFGYA
ncbi:unnamed protein product, partial [Allacma fusca]